MKWATQSELLALGNGIWLAELALQSLSPIRGEAAFVKSSGFTVNQAAVALDSHFGLVGQFAVTTPARSNCGHYLVHLGNRKCVTSGASKCVIGYVWYKMDNNKYNSS